MNCHKKFYGFTKKKEMETNMILELVVGLMAFLKVVFNYVKSDKAVRIFGRIDDIINFFVTDKLKDEEI
tara:strand:+ start:847 stop:1053 length:207 start_codon:yes stop_codon:yes gene_type:complete